MRLQQLQRVEHERAARGLRRVDKQKSTCARTTFTEPPRQTHDKSRDEVIDSASESDDLKWTTVENRNKRRSARNREEKLSNQRSTDSDSGSSASDSGESKGRSRAHRKRVEGAKRANVKSNMHKISSTPRRRRAKEVHVSTIGRA